MRLFSQQLMEAGTEFSVSDGLNLRMAGQTVRVSPASDREAIFIYAPEEKAACACRELLKKLED